MVRLIDERTTAFRAVIASAPDLGVQVPTCPDWTLFELAEHIGAGRRAWAATVLAGPGATGRASAPAEPAAPREREALVDWVAASVEEMLGALRTVGPDQGCWTWWGDSQSPSTAGAVARHQLQEMAVHTYDAQLTVGAPQPLPDEVTLDGVDEFLSTCVATTSAWPHEPVTIDFHTTEGRSWRLWLSADGARSAAGEHADAPDASVRGTASDLVLFFYDRLRPESMRLEGDRRQFDRLIAWDPSA
ncbi:maleylpyruvate isomerase family mycothiol-dependent enzyme [Paractinoplanes maris]|uniref:maleylpyruvate isomerase family mycothiol-dependent enzyme n=1 Tax=Paractinoplanes maris TaxID=1734446 RepID=UPI002020D333|nr:maleylpyruvate isomerase family mycothiol-dependent enzyme [Actinoplanes maris]